MSITLRQALEQALNENPDDLATHMAYADHLVEQGDPRGEFIQVQLALEDPSQSPEERQRLRKRERDLLRTHHVKWLGAADELLFRPYESYWLGSEEYGPFAGLGVTFARGWVHALYDHRLTRRLMEALADCPTIRLLRWLAIDRTSADELDSETVQRLPFLDRVQRFQIGIEEEGHASGAGVEILIAGMHRLEELYLYAHNVDTRAVFALALPYLRTLAVYHLRDYPLEVLAANPTLGNLVTLSCWPHALTPDDQEAYIRADNFVALTRSRHLKSLSCLALYLSDIGDIGARALVESGMLGRLRDLDLWSGRITDAGARLLAASPDIRKLQRLRIAANQLTPAGIQALQDASVQNLDADNQFDAVQIAESRHLYQGDIE